LRFYIIIPAYNEAENIGATLQSLATQSLLPSKLMVVNDNSTDATSKIVESFIDKYEFIEQIFTTEKGEHSPGSKVVNAFNYGYSYLDDDFDIICKFDADLIFPPDYLQTLSQHFSNDPRVGIAGGFCTIQYGNGWKVENLTGKDHIRGALKAYRKQCFLDIGGLKPAMGWDTVDELLAQYNNWKIITDDKLLVKHLKPTGSTYKSSAKFKQGQAFYSLRYGFLISLIASAKLALKKGSLNQFINYIVGYLKAKKEKRPYLVNEDEGRFIRKLRWSKMSKKIF
jgi:glycosyltransferase involved in cell wall biosynthesis